MDAPEFGPDIGNLRHRNPGREPFVEQRFIKGERGLELGFRKGAASALVAQHPRPGRQRQRRQLLIFVERIEQRIIAVARLLFDLVRSEEHTSELQSLMRISYAVFCLQKKKTQNRTD